MKRLITSALAALSIGASQATASSVSLNRVSFYTATVRETDATPHLGYCKLNGSYRLPANAIGLTDTLLAVFPCGTRVRITLASGRVFTGVVADRMPSRWGRAADIRVGSRREAIRLGVSTGRIERLR